MAQADQIVKNLSVLFPWQSEVHIPGYRAWTTVKQPSKPQLQTTGAGIPVSESQIKVQLKLDLSVHQFGDGFIAYGNWAHIKTSTGYEIPNSIQIPYIDLDHSIALL